MTRNTKKIIAASSVVLILVAILIIVLLLPQSENENNAPTAITLINRDYMEVEEISFTNEYGSFELIGYLTENEYASRYTEESSSQESEQTSTAETYETMVYTMQEYPGNMLSHSLTQELAYHCAHITASQIVDKTGTRYADFGLDKPRATISVVYSDNTTKTFYIGNDAAGSESTVYIRFEGDKYVYLVALDTVSMFLDDGLQLFDKSLSIELERDAYAESLTISGTFLDTPIKISASDDTTTYSSYMMFSPYREICDDDTFKSYCEVFFDLYADTVIAVDIEESELSKYGLDKPYSDVFVTSTCGSIHILTSKPDENKKCYVMAAGETIVYQCDAEDLPWLEISYKLFLSDIITAPNTIKMSEMNVKTSTSSHSFKLTHKTNTNLDEKESIISTVNCNGKNIDYQYFLNFISNLSEMTRTEREPDNAPKDELILSVSFVYEDVTNTLEVYSSGKSDAVVVLNGVTEAYTDLQYAKELVQYADKLSQNQEIPKRSMAEEEEAS